MGSSLTEPKSYKTTSKPLRTRTVWLEQDWLKWCSVATLLARQTRMVITHRRSATLWSRTYGLSLSQSTTWNSQSSVTKSKTGSHWWTTTNVCKNNSRLAATTPWTRIGSQLRACSNLWAWSPKSCPRMTQSLSLACLGLVIRKTMCSWIFSSMSSTWSLPHSNRKLTSSQHKMQQLRRPVIVTTLQQSLKGSLRWHLTISCRSSLASVQVNVSQF